MARFSPPNQYQLLLNESVRKICDRTNTLYNFWNSNAKADTLTHAQVKEINRAIGILAVIVTEARVLP